MPLLPHLPAYAPDADSEECPRLASEHGSAQVRFVPLALAAAPGTAELPIRRRLGNLFGTVAEVPTWPAPGIVTVTIETTTSSPSAP